MYIKKNVYITKKNGNTVCNIFSSLFMLGLLKCLLNVINCKKEKIEPKLCHKLSFRESFIFGLTTIVRYLVKHLQRLHPR